MTIVGGQLDIDEVPGEPSWELARSYANSGCLSEEGIQASTWALDVLEDYLGSTWPRRQFRRQSWIPGFVIGFANWRHELPILLALASNVAAFGDKPGAQAVRKLATNSATRSGWRHFVLQFEVARASTAVGEFLKFEPKIDSTKRSGDVEVVIGGTNALVEVTSVSRSNSDLRHEGFEHRLFGALRAIALDVSVSMEVEVKTTAVPDDVVATWLARVRDISVAATRTGATFRDNRGFASVVVSPASFDGAVAAGVAKFTGVIHARDGWSRIKDALRDKARQTLGASGVWIRLDAVDGLFSLTDWAQRPMPQRITEIATNVRLAFAGFEHVHGVVISSGAGLWMSDPADPSLHERAEADDAVLLRRAPARGLARETVVVPLLEVGCSGAHAWVDAYGHEASWLKSDLLTHGWSLGLMRPLPESI